MTIGLSLSMDPVEIHITETPHWLEYQGSYLVALGVTLEEIRADTTERLPPPTGKVAGFSGRMQVDYEDIPAHDDCRYRFATTARFEHAVEVAYLAAVLRHEGEVGITRRGVLPPQHKSPMARWVISELRKKDFLLEVTKSVSGRFDPMVHEVLQQITGLGDEFRFAPTFTANDLVAWVVSSAMELARENRLARP